MHDFSVFLGVQSTPSPFLAIGLAQSGAGEPWLLQGWDAQREDVKAIPVKPI